MSQSYTPKSGLGYYRQIAPNASLFVSPLCLGAMSLGQKWDKMLGGVDKQTAFEILDYYYDNDGNFIDTANMYQDDESEEWIGEWMEKRGNRNDLVIATKYTGTWSKGKQTGGIQVNYAGNGRKSMVHSIEASLKKLRTDYVDILYVHWWDWTANVEEVMISLNHLIASGKVLYLGVSDTPAWIVSKANQYARDHGLSPFVIYQGKWNLLDRDMERDIIPMCRAEGMGIAPWNALGGGRFKTEEQLKQLQESGEKARDTSFLGGITEQTKKVTTALEELAKKKETNITGAALNYLLSKEPYVFPIVGGRKVSHLKDNVESLKLEPFSEEELKGLESVAPFDIGFPANFVGNRPGEGKIMQNVWKRVYVKDAKPVNPKNF
eukprot:TRINITY_DN246_c0_g1_i1.p1 TRINITY_DN246_c0_g1~~TRINITY_DN246_c0_g1_i1.p1  ORF type:complete len:379 (-),score=149.25 TRINITY_DN246_c0_g1_i1:213-1349(-)